MKPISQHYYLDIYQYRNLLASQVQKQLLFIRQGVIVQQLPMTQLIIIIRVKQYESHTKQPGGHACNKISSLCGERIKLGSCVLSDNISTSTCFRSSFSQKQSRKPTEFSLKTSIFRHGWYMHQGNVLPSTARFRKFFTYVNSAPPSPESRRYNDPLLHGC